METNQILAADLLDLLFENRNKDYGAYELRKTYIKRITKALFITGAITSALFVSFFISHGKNRTSGSLFKVDTVVISKIDPDKPPPPPPPPPPPKVEPPVVATAQFTPPKIVREVPPDEMPPENKDLINTKIDVVSRAGADDNGLAPQLDEHRNVIEEKKEETDDKVFVGVQIEASFPGGENAWRHYLERKLNANAPVENGAPAGEYRVWVQFVVDKEGGISDVKATTHLGYGMEEEAVKIIKNGPNWIPAIQNGNKVKAYRKQSILFIVQADN
jgi:protein TonB